MYVYIKLYNKEITNNDIIYSTREEHHTTSNLTRGRSYKVIAIGQLRAECPISTTLTSPRGVTLFTFKRASLFLLLFASAVKFVPCPFTPLRGGITSL